MPRMWGPLAYQHGSPSLWVRRAGHQRLELCTRCPQHDSQPWLQAKQKQHPILSQYYLLYGGSSNHRSQICDSPSRQNRQTSHSPQGGYDFPQHRDQWRCQHQYPSTTRHRNMGRDPANCQLEDEHHETRQELHYCQGLTALRSMAKGWRLCLPPPANMLPVPEHVPCLPVSGQTGWPHALRGPEDPLSHQSWLSLL